jgi:hypothetical protein
LFTTQQPAPEPTVTELRIEAQREVGGLLALVDQESLQRPIAAESAHRAGLLRLGGSMMTIFFAPQAARWPTGLRYELDGARLEVEGVDAVECGTQSHTVPPPSSKSASVFAIASEDH